jgi:hypothetical protein
MTAIDENVVTRATSTSPRSSESSRLSTGAGNFVRERNARSPPRSARDCERTERVRLLENESIATSAATPSEMEDM